MMSVDHTGGFYYEHQRVDQELLQRNVFNVEDVKPDD